MIVIPAKAGIQYSRIFLGLSCINYKTDSVKPGKTEKIIFPMSQIVFVCPLFFCLLVFLFLPSLVFSYDSSSNDFKKYISALEQQSSHYGWTDIKPGAISWEYHRTTKNKHLLMFTHFGNTTGNCVLFLGGVHGDELPTVYLMFKLAHYVKDNPALFKDKSIVIAPLINPDGFLSASPTRVNVSGVDINRNFPTKDWQASAIRQWIARGEKTSATILGQNRHQSRKHSFRLL